MGGTKSLMGGCRGKRIFCVGFQPPLGVDSTDACLSLKVPRGNGINTSAHLKGFLLYLACVSVSILLEISIANGAVDSSSFHCGQHSVK